MILPCYFIVSKELLVADDKRQRAIYNHTVGTRYVVLFSINKQRWHRESSTDLGVL